MLRYLEVAIPLKLRKRRYVSSEKSLMIGIYVYKKAIFGILNIKISNESEDHTDSIPGISECIFLFAAVYFRPGKIAHLCGNSIPL